MPGGALQLVDLRHGVVADADFPRQSFRLQLEKPLPYVRSRAPTRWPVDEPQIDVIERERVETCLERLALTPRAAGRQLRRDEDVFTANGTVRHCLPHLFLVAIRGGRIDVSIADVERAQHGVDRTSAPQLPCSEPENGQLRTCSEFHTLALDAARFGAQKAVLPLKGTVAASDAFFPFPDGLEAVASAGATAVIQPGGSVKDDDVIAAADKLGIAMVFTGIRHFRH